jgi:hypothetical protein
MGTLMFAAAANSKLPMMASTTFRTMEDVLVVGQSFAARVVFIFVPCLF